MLISAEPFDTLLSIACLNWSQCQRDQGHGPSAIATHLVRDIKEDRDHLPHVVDIERRVQELALTAVVVACMTSKSTDI